MKTLITLLCLFTVSAHAHNISFIGPCDKKPLLEQEVSAEFANTVGQLTIEFLIKKNIAFEGTEKGLHTVFNTPVGAAALEIISKTEMRAYGWCYFVNDLGPDVFADEYPLAPQEMKIEWIFGFAHYKKGVWLSSCTPAFTIKPKFLCQ